MSGRAPTAATARGRRGAKTSAQAGSSKTGDAAARSVPLVTSSARLACIATFHARSGLADRVVERLLHAAGLVAEAPGCELWLVHRDQRDPDTVRVSELWSNGEQAEGALTLPGVRDNAAEIMNLVDRPPEVIDGEPVGGARMLRGTSGATRLSILDAPDLSQDTELLGR